ncbi:hypothetical protein TNCV_3993011 [Trichonephila clavipes]|uniref:Uncharacterized protein n=1 Tax=Trichonephila clavipes TaxID=2585209 RepID=A0A8X6SWC1_TRICX|nr:hypothetical protein TNCV_3993011 [Trichonephila clavipes]
MPRGKHRASFAEVSEFDRKRIVACRDCALSFREISQRFRRNQATVMWICHRWIDGANHTHFVAPLLVMTCELCSRIRNHSITDSV